MAENTTTTVERATNVFVGGVQVGTRALTAPGIAVHAGENHAGEGFAITVLQAVTTAEQKEAFEDIARFAELSGIVITKKESHVILSTPAPAGNFRDLHWESWQLSERLDQFKNAVALVRRFHEQAVPVGALSPECIMVDDQLNLFVLGPRLSSRTGPYVAPETVRDRLLDLRSDIFSLGQLLYFVTAKQEPPREAYEVPRLEGLLELPAGLVRIVRKATCLDPELRYQSVDALLADLDIYGRHDQVGLKHPEVEETNLGGLSLSPQRPPEAEEAPPAEKIEQRSPEMVPLIGLGQPNWELRRKIRRVVASTIIVGGLALILIQRAAIRPDLATLDSEQLAGLPAEVVSISLTQSHPLAFFAEVAPSWDQMTGEERRALVETIIKTSRDRWQASDGFIMRGSATVAQHWNGKLLILGPGEATQ